MENRKPDPEPAVSNTARSLRKDTVRRAGKLPVRPRAPLGTSTNHSCDVVATALGRALAGCDAT